MRSGDVLGYSFSAIRLRKMRAGLTTLGVAIGIAAIVALLSFTGGLQVTMTEQFEEGLGTDTLTVSTGGILDLLGGGGGDSDFSLLINDTDVINSIEHVEATVASMTKTIVANFSGDEFPLSLSGIDFTAYTSMYSTFVTVNGTIPAAPADTDVIIGSRVADPWQNGTIVAQVGDEVTIIWTGRVNGSIVMTNYTGTVVAILEEIGGFGFSGPSDIGFYVPMEWAIEFFETEEISSITVKMDTDDPDEIDTLMQEIEDAFEGLVTVTQPAALLGMMEEILGILNVFLAGIAGISLIVAGIGIMNIMIVSLIERTREIGILKGMGMHSRTVLGIFLSEAMMIGLLGGVFGIVAGVLIGNLIAGGMANMGGMGGEMFGGFSGIPEITPVITLDLLFFALVFGVLVAVIFGLYPAHRASKLKPVDALRYE